MRIAQIAPLHEAVPPMLYGGTERVVSFPTEELVALGHDVTLFASGDSCIRATLVPAWPRALRLDPGVRDTTAPHMLLMEQVRRRAAEFDILHFHLDYNGRRSHGGASDARMDDPGVHQPASERRHAPASDPGVPATVRAACEPAHLVTELSFQRSGSCP